MDEKLPEELLSLDRITTQGTQARAALSPTITDEYAEAMTRGDEFPPIDVYFDGTTHWLADGFHRVAAAHHAYCHTIAAIIHEGSMRDALLHALGANETHGHRRDDRDRRHAVGLMLTDAEWQQWSNNEIARHCVVSEHLVRTLRDELEPAQETEGAPERTRKATRKGKTYTMRTGRIGSAASQQKPSAPAPIASVASPAPALPPPEDQTVVEHSVLSSTQSKTDRVTPATPSIDHEEMPSTSVVHAEPEDTVPPEQTIPQPQQSLIHAWQEASAEERHAFIAIYHHELQTLLAAYETPAAAQTPREYKAHLLQQMIAWKSEGLTMEAIAHQLNEQQIQTFSGRGAWSKGTVAKLLAKEKQGIPVLG